MTEAARFLDFGPFRLDRRERLLSKSGEPVPLPPKAVDLLIALTDEPGELHTKDELMARVWPDVIVDEANLTQNIFILRKALEDDGTRWIITVPRRGYRFVGTRAGTSISESSAFSSVVLVTTLVVGLLGIPLVMLFRSPRHRQDDIRKIAVLPFHSIDGRREDHVLELGMADTLINKLSQISGLVVRPTHAITPYLGSRADAVTAGRDLGVNGVIEGNLQHDGHRIRCSVRLVRVADGDAIWADTFDEEESSVFDIEDRIASRVLPALNLRLRPEQRNGLTSRYTSNRRAYELYLNGRLSWESFEREGLETSVRYFNEALKIDPRYAPAYAGLGKTYSVMAIYGLMDRDEAWAHSRDASVHALELDPQLADAHTALAAEAIFNDWNWNRAGEETRRALELDPSSDAHTLRAYYLQATGRPDDAISELRKERELDPLWLLAKNDCIVGLYLARRYDEAIAEGMQLLEVQPRDNVVRYYVGKSLRLKSHLDDAAVQQQTIAQQVPDYVRSIGELGAISAMRGDRQAALARITQIEKLRAADPFRRSDYAIASVWAALGDRDQAFQSLDRSYETHYPFLWQVRDDAAFDSLRNDPRFKALLTRLHM